MTETNPWHSTGPGLPVASVMSSINIQRTPTRSLELEVDLELGQPKLNGIITSNNVVFHTTKFYSRILVQFVKFETVLACI